MTVTGEYAPSDLAELRDQAREIRRVLRENVPRITRGIVREARKAHSRGVTYKAFAEARGFDYQSLLRRIADRERWEWRVRQYGRRGAGDPP